MRQKGLIHVVIDTNIFISELRLVKRLMTTEDQTLVIFIPWSVIKELDHLKTREVLDLAASAREAIDYIYQQLEAKNPKVCKDFFANGIKTVGWDSHNVLI